MCYEYWNTCFLVALCYLIVGLSHEVVKQKITLNHLTLRSFTFICLSDYWKVLSVVPVFKKVGEWCTSKKYCPVSLLSLVSKVFEKRVNKICWSRREMWSFLLLYGFRYSPSTADLLKVISDRIASAFNRSGAREAVRFFRWNSKKKTLNLLTLLSFVLPLSVFQIVGRSRQ